MATHVFYGLNDYRLGAPDDEPYDLILAVASGEVDYRQVAASLGRWAQA